jgi:hypothetical protein
MFSKGAVLGSEKDCPKLLELLSVEPLSVANDLILSAEARFMVAPLLGKIDRETAPRSSPKH